MTPKPASTDSEASNKDAAASPPGDSDADGVDALEAAKPMGESYDDSLEAILLQAGARPPEPAASKLLGSKTLMGLGIEGLNLASIRAAGDARGAATAERGAPIQTDEGTHRTGTTQSEDKEVTSLLDEVAQALNVQATEYRDRARGRLPGMPSAAAPSGKPPGHVAFTSGRSEDAEFEDPDDNPVALTPGIISVVDEHDDAEPDVSLDAEDEAGRRLADDSADDEAVVLAPSEPGGSGRGRDTKSVSRPLAVPPVPGLTLGTAPPTIGPPPGLAPRPPTPSGGLSPISGRVRLPTPAPGSPVPPLPSPGVGRMTLPLGIAIPPSSALGGTDLTATAPATPIALETSRRANGSGRVSTRRNTRTTEQVVPISSSSLPSVLTAHVKLATVSLAGLIAVTFAGGLFVGMLVWKGQGRGEHASSSAALTPPPATVPANANAPATTGAAAPAAAAVAATNVAPAIPPATEVVVTPLVPGSPSPETAALTTPKPVRRLAAAARPRRPAPAPTVADTAALFPKTVAGKPGARPATGAAAPASKPMATNAATKPAAKSKTKTTWHDPFAD